MKDWTTPRDLRSQVLKRWDRGDLLACAFDGEELFPLRLRLDRPTNKEYGERFGEAQAWAKTLTDGGRHYRVEFREVRHRQLGDNALPHAVWLDDRNDALALIGKRDEAHAFDRIVQETREREPTVLPWLARRPLQALELAGDWPRLLDVVAWLRDHPNSGLYLRQVDLPGIDSKFIESHRGVLGELFALAVPECVLALGDAPASAFEARWGFRTKPARVRFRVLDSSLSVLGAGAEEDLEVPVDQFASLDVGASTVFVIENEIDFLAFPERAGSMAVFGAGYGFAWARAPWLRRMAIHYWGDIDTHGFAILDGLRSTLPHARSLLMDRETLIAHRTAWAQERSPARRDLVRLTAEESALYDDLRCDRLGTSVRLEQERVRYSWLELALNGLELVDP